MEQSLWQPRAPWRHSIQLTSALALFSGIPQLARGQTGALAPSAFLWGSASNASVSLIFGSAKGRALVVFGLAGDWNTGERTATVGTGVRFNTGTARTSLLVEGLFGSAGWAAGLAAMTRSDFGRASASGRLTLTHPLQSGGDAPAVHGSVTLHGRLSHVLRWGTSYAYDVEAREVGEHRLGPSLEVRLPRAAIRVDFGHGLGRAADELCVRVMVPG